MLEALLTVIIVFLGCGISFFTGYKIGKKLTKADTVQIRKNKPLLDSTTWQTASFGPKTGSQEQVNPNAEKLSQKDDIINHEGVGIVYRPTEEEINKMNEPESVRQAKEAVAETIRNTPAPEI